MTPCQHKARRARACFCREQRVAAELLRDIVGRDERFAAAIQRALVAVAPNADGVLKPKWFDGDDDSPVLLGAA